MLGEVLLYYLVHGDNYINTPLLLYICHAMMKRREEKRREEKRREERREEEKRGEEKRNERKRGEKRKGRMTQRRFINEVTKNM